MYVPLPFRSRINGLSDLIVSPSQFHRTNSLITCELPVAYISNNATNANRAKKSIGVDTNDQVCEVIST